MRSQFSRATSGNVPTTSSLRSALTLTEVIVILVGLGLVGLFIFMLPAMRGPTRGPSRRTACAANLKGIGTGLYTYASENQDIWPIAPHMAAVEVGVGRTAYAPKLIGLNRGDGKDPESGKTTEQDMKISNTRNIWMLVRMGASSPKSFICPSSSDTPNEEDNPQMFWDFKSWNETSYGYQVAYGTKGRPTSDCDQRMPLAADKGPYGAALENGQINPGVPNIGASTSPDDWRKWNSPNHGGVGKGEGQVVLFADSHAEFMTRPTGGIKNDNIYTRWSGVVGGVEANESARAWGTPPTGNETPWSDTDTLIYP